MITSIAFTTGMSGQAIPLLDFPIDLPAHRGDLWRFSTLLVN